MEEEKEVLTTQEIHKAVEERSRQKIPYKHLQILMERFTECCGEPITDDNLEAFLRYAWE